MSELIPLPRERIVGHTLLEIWQTFEENDEYGLYFAVSYYLLDGDVSFRLPRDDFNTFLFDAVPPDAGPIGHPLLPQIYGRRIVDVQWADESYDDAAYLVLDNGFFVSDVLSTPFGILPGVYIYEPSKMKDRAMRPFWPP